MKLIDTSALIDMLRKKSYEAGAISVITLIEVLRGIRAEKRSRVKKLIEESFEVLNLDNEVIETYCNLYNAFKERGEMVSEADLLIASTAISHGLVLKTRDKHFNKLKPLGLEVELSS